MANPTLLKSISVDWPTNSWESKCIALLNTTSTFKWSKGLVDGYGQPVSKLTDKAWGISVQTCYQYCNANLIPFVFNFASFSGSITNYFLPWLALTAQLPYETGDPWENLMSFCLAVGSPALITYSLAITILNRFWVRRKFKGLRVKARANMVQHRFNGYESRISASQFLLQEGQQVPLRASQEKGWLSSLIVIPDNSDWWKRLETRLRNTRRGVTASLVAQMLFAIIAFLFTIISSFDTALGDPATALQIASGSLWIWLIPVIAGWITVGTQYRADTIDEALEDEQAYRALEPPILPGSDYTELTGQRGLVVRPGLNPQPHRVQTAVGAFDAPGLEHLQLPTWSGADVGGDEQRKGPIYNYARLFTWWQLASSVERALFRTLDGVANGRVCASGQRQTRPSWDSNIRAKENLTGDIRGTAEYCGLATQPILAYPRWSDIPPQVYRRIVGASLAAIFLQWGTTGASILIAYLTPTVGLGCRSSSYILYGSLATTVWLCLLASMFLSHAVMLRYQGEHVSNPSMDFRLRHDPNNPNQYTRTFSHACLCAAAVVLRYIGKFLAVLNALWLIVSSLLEFTGGYDNCWCKGNAPGMGSNGWIVLFKDGSDLAARARLPWGGGLFMTILVCMASYIFFFLGSLKTDDD